MNLTSKQRIVLLALTTEWQTPIQIAKGFPTASGDFPDVQKVLKDLLRVGLVQINPVVIGLYRLTPDGITIKELELRENQ
ncbi:hypothetical protein MJA45_02165 [Paenibacillus aurantius]|uniref:Uncharacterized protein n=1 Tax=Paenibacillus aurantius TaxID=2918900 RepID=A0AA96LF39_9BACL|nr:hypothetical protein [Paenibacillus aurantius]WNQ11883.1 hypothetical protein MJA45_02165 [Paenibacillus aurantius]